MLKARENQLRDEVAEGKELQQKVDEVRRVRRREDGQVGVGGGEGESLEEEVGGEEEEEEEKRRRRGGGGRVYNMSVLAIVHVCPNVGQNARNVLLLKCSKSLS